MRGLIGWGAMFLGICLAPVSALAQDAAEGAEGSPDSGSEPSTPVASETSEASGEASESADGDEEEIPEEVREAARVAYARGESNFRDGRFLEAEAAFREAYEAVPNPVVLLSVAEAQEQDGRGAEASRTLTEYLSLRADAPDRAEVEARIAALEGSPARLVLRSFPEGASIRIDGTDRSEITPAEVEVAPGEHQVTFLQEGYEEATQSVVTEHATTHTLEMTLAEAGPPGDDPFGESGDGGEYDAGLGDDGVIAESEISPAVWVAASVAGAGLVAGTVLGFLALSEQADFDDMPTESAADRGERLALFADVSFGLAAAAGLTAIVLYLTDKEGESQGVFEDGESDAEETTVAARPRTRVRYAPSVTPESAGMAARVEF